MQWAQCSECSTRAGRGEISSAGLSSPVEVHCSRSRVWVVGLAWTGLGWNGSLELISGWWGAFRSKFPGSGPPSLPRPDVGRNSVLLCFEGVVVVAGSGYDYLSGGLEWALRTSRTISIQMGRSSDRGRRGGLPRCYIASV